MARTAGRERENAGREVVEEQKRAAGTVGLKKGTGETAAGTEGPRPPAPPPPAALRRPTLDPTRARRPVARAPRPAPSTPTGRRRPGLSGRGDRPQWAGREGRRCRTGGLPSIRTGRPTTGRRPTVMGHRGILRRTATHRRTITATTRRPVALATRLPWATTRLADPAAHRLQAMQESITTEATPALPVAAERRRRMRARTEEGRRHRPAPRRRADPVPAARRRRRPRRCQLLCLGATRCG